MSPTSDAELEERLEADREEEGSVEEGGKEDNRRGLYSQPMEGEEDLVWERMQEEGAEQAESEQLEGLSSGSEAERAQKSPHASRFGRLMEGHKKVVKAPQFLCFCRKQQLAAPTESSRED